MSRQKAKGNSFERSIAQDLTEVFQLPFTRTFGSGAFLGGKNQHRRAGVSKAIQNASLGDIACPTEHGWDFIIECKSYASLNFNGIIQGYCDKLSGWISEVRFDANNKANHMVCFKIDRAGVYIVLPYVEDKAKELLEVEVPYMMYPYYSYNEEKEVNELDSWYCVVNYNYLNGAYNDEFPEMQQAVKQYLEYLAKELE